ncbi:MAG: helix-turn-helix domain-containing protein [Crocosphaera sp.]
MGDTTLATFRVDKDTWKEFKEWASERGSNASTELNQFILRSLGRIDTNLDVNIDSRDNRIDIDKRIENYLDNNLDERIEATVKNYLDKHIDRHIDTNPDQRIDKSIDNDIDSKKETNLDTNIDSSIDSKKEINIDSDIDENIDKEPTTKDEETSVTPETTVTESVGEEEVIEPLADEKGLSRKELASKIGVRPEYLTRWKSGKNIPKEDSENYQAYQDFCNYRWQKKKGSNQAKYYRDVR